MNKTSFPKVQDKGEASASVVFSAQIKFSLFPDEDGSVEVKDVACGFKITSLDVKVLSGNLKMLYKMLVNVFQEKLTSSVESDLAGTIRKTLPMLRKVPTHPQPHLRARVSCRVQHCPATANVRACAPRVALGRVTECWRGAAAGADAEDEGDEAREAPLQGV